MDQPNNQTPGATAEDDQIREFLLMKPHYSGQASDLAREELDRAYTMMDLSRKLRFLQEVHDSVQGVTKALKESGDVLKQLTTSNDAKARAELGYALRRAVEVIRQWHGDDNWESYINHAREMKPIREALVKHA